MNFVSFLEPSIRFLSVGIICLVFEDVYAVRVIVVPVTNLCSNLYNVQ